MNTKRPRFLTLTGTLCLYLSLVTSAGHGETLQGAEILTGVWKGQPIEYLDGEILVGLHAGKTQRDFTDELGSLPVGIARPADHTGFLKLRVKDDRDLFSLIDQVAHMSCVRYAEPNMVDRLHVVPDDPDFSKQWHYDNTGQDPPAGTPDADIDGPEAWDITTGSTTIKVGVLDGGLPIEAGSLTHPDLDDATRFLFGWDFVNGDSIPEDDRGHGTHVSGTIAAETDNGIGVAGVAWNVKILAIKVFNADGSGSSENFRDACMYAADSGCKVINYSGGGPANSTKEWGVAYADTLGVVLCASVGNDYSGPVEWPAAYSPQYSNVIAVSATDHTDQFSEYSNKGPEVTVCAPGGYGAAIDANDVYSTMPGYYVSLNDEGYTQDYSYMAGTSMASPHVAGLAALILSIKPTLAPDSVRELIKNWADDRGAPGRDDYYGWGRINARRSLKCCIGIRGNVDNDSLEQINIVDIVYLMEWIFLYGPPPPCPEEADVDADESINVIDLVILVEYLFCDGPPPAPCP